MEFFPFLNTSLRLDIVDIEQDIVQETSAGGATSSFQDQETNPDETGGIKEGGVAERDIAEVGDVRPSVTESDLNEEITHPNRLDEQTGSTVAVTERPLEIQASAGGEDMEVIEDAPSNMDFEEDADGGVASESDVFFDAKGFPEVEADLAQKSNSSSEGDSKDDINHKTDKASLMDIDQEPNALGETPAPSVALPETCINAERDAGDSNNDLEANGHETYGHSTPALELQPPKILESVSPLPIVKKPAEAKASQSLEPKTPMAALPKSSFRRIPQDDDDLAEYHLPVGHNVRYIGMSTAFRIVSDFFAPYFLRLLLSKRSNGNLFFHFAACAIEPTETELAERVEYDMDEQGKNVV